MAKDLRKIIPRDLARQGVPEETIEDARRILEEIYEEIEDVKKRTRPDYYLPCSTLWRKLICVLRFFPLLGPGHEFEDIYSREPDRLEIEGEHALICKICYRVESHGPFRGFLPNIIYGSSPGSGRSLPVRKVMSVTEELARIGNKPASV